MNQEIQNHFLRLMKYAMYDSQACHNYVFGNDTTKPDKVMALSYVGTALANLASAESLYYSNLKDVEHVELPELFHLFRTFLHEVQNNYATDHSHQWSSIEFEKLKEAFEDSVCSSPIIE